MSATAVLLFAKAPEPGRVNTRLIPVLGAERAARLHGEMVRWKAAQLAGCGLQLWGAPTLAHPLFEQLAAQHRLPRYRQSGRDLGARMANALSHALQRSSAVVLLGTDCPTLSQAAVDEALERLGSGRVDAVLAPAEDGGFGLIGVNRMDSRIFEGVRWGTAEVLARTREQMRQVGWRWSELSSCWDVDRPADLKRLYRFPGTPLSIRRLLEEAGTEVLE